MASLTLKQGAIMKLVKITEATNSPVTDAEHKLFSKIDLTDDDALVTSLNETATDYIQDTLEKSFTDEVFELHLDGFPDNDCPIDIHRTPLDSITSIKYIDTDGVEQTMTAANYKVDTVGEPASVHLAFGKSWPTAREEVNAVKVTFTAGYGTAITDVPERYKTIIKHMFAHLYEHREPMKDKKWVEIPEHLNTLIDKYRIKTFG
jgi:uncharacterized phiE125 gp8 family phage protein